MSAITQLETIRTEALARLAQNSDYRLVSKLDELIGELQALDTTTLGTDAQVELITTEVETTSTVDTLSENAISSELDETFDALSNEFCTSLRKETALNGNPSH